METSHMRNRTTSTLSSLLAVAVLFGWLARPATSAQSAKDTPTSVEARAIAKEACIYGFPLVDNYRVMHSYFVERGGPEFKAPWNTIHNEARVYTPQDKAIQTPNSDTPYSQIGTDLRAEPLVITVPAVDKDRYYSLQFIDLYTHNYAYVGSRATGHNAGSYLLAGPNWQGETPDGIRAVIRSETQLGWVLFRTQLFNPDDIEGVKKVQSGYNVQTLSNFLGEPAPPAAPTVEFVKPLTPAQQKTSIEFFRVLDFALQFCPVHPSESALRARFARLGIGTGSFDPTKLSPETREAMEDGIADAWEAFADLKATQIDTGLRTAADGYGTREFLKNDYLGRMSSAVLGIYGNTAEEAMYPAYFVDADGATPNGANRYTMRFAPDELPPVNSFWSVTMYELPSSLLVANPLNRYLINSAMLASLKRDADGGLTLYVQHEPPGAEKESNWLPAPAGDFFLIMRLYWPKEEALSGAWMQPPLRRVDGDGTGASGAPVTVENFVRAESDTYFAATVKGYDAFGKFGHNRVPTPIDKQTIIRMNRDTLYSAAVFDLDAAPVTITLPDAGDRFLSMQVINQDHDTPMVVYGGKVTLTRERIGTRYVITAVRILADPSDPKDLQEVARLQDAIKVEQQKRGTFEVPSWDPVSQKKIRDALLVLADTLPDKNGMFGARGEGDPVRRLLGAASGWGGNPDKDAVYLNITPKENDGQTVYRLTVKDVPVDSFWSISVYNAKGYFEPNSANAYTLNNLTAKKDTDGSVTVQFGGCDGKTSNCLPVTPGWNYMVRLYRPRPEILKGEWRFPEAQPVP